MRVRRKKKKRREKSSDIGSMCGFATLSRRVMLVLPKLAQLCATTCHMVNCDW